MKDAVAITASRPGRLLLLEEWVLRAVLAFVEDDGDEIHNLWLLAIRDELRDLQLLLEQHFLLSVHHARRLAMVHSMWSVLLQLSGFVKYTKGQRLSAETVDEIETQLALVGGVPSHPLRRHALRTAVGRDHRPEVPRSMHCSRCGGTHANHCSGLLHRCTAPGSDEIHHFCHEINAFAMYAAAQRGYLESVVWLHYVVCYDQEIALRLAAKAGHVAIVSWLLDHPHAGITVDFRYRDDEALGVMAWRVQPFSQYYTMTKKWGFESSLDRYIPACMALKRGDIDGLRALFAHPFTRPLFTKTIASYAIGYGSIPVLEFLLTHCPEVFSTELDMWSAGSEGRVVVAEWLIAHSFGEINDRLVRAAMIHGQVAFLQWILRGAAHADEMRQAMIREAENGTTLATLQWLATHHGLRLNTTTHARAAIHRRDTERVKWIIEYCTATRPLANGRALLEDAIKTENLELVQWLVEHHHAWSPRAFSLASGGTSVALLEYMYTTSLMRPSRGPSLIPGPPMFVVERRKAFDGRCQDAVAWLLDRGFRSGLFEHGALDTILQLERHHAKTQRELALTKFYGPPAMRRLRDALYRLIDEYDADYIRQTLWLPKWAARHGRVDALNRLAELGHVNVFSRRLFDSLLRGAASERVVLWYLKQKPELFTTLVVRWAVQHGKRGVFEWVFQSFLPAQDPLAAETVRLRRKCVRTALWTAARFQRYEITRGLAGFN